MYVVNRENDNLSVNKGILALEKGNYGQCNKFKAYVSVSVFESFSFPGLLFSLSSPPFHLNLKPSKPDPPLGLRGGQTESDHDRAAVSCAELLQLAN